MKKVLSIGLVVVMLFSMSCFAFADPQDGGNIPFDTSGPYWED